MTRTGETTSHWVMRQADDDDDGQEKHTDKTIEWDSEILRDEPGRRIAWRSIGGESDNAGEVVFEPAPGGRGTMVTVLQEFRMGKLASAWETLVGRNPKQAVIENLLTATTWFRLACFAIQSGRGSDLLAVHRFLDPCDRSAWAVRLAMGSWDLTRLRQGFEMTEIFNDSLLGISPYECFPRAG